MQWRRGQKAKGQEGRAAELSERRVPASRASPGPKPVMARAEEKKRLHRVPLARKRSWPAALLGASILSSCFLLTQSQEVPVTQKPLNPMEGRDVTLTPGGVDNAMVHTCPARNPASSIPTEAPPTTNNTILWIIFGCLAGTLVLIGTLLFFFLRARRRRDGTFFRTITPLSLHGILSSSGQVKPEDSAVSNIYQTLEPGSQAVYADLSY